MVQVKAMQAERDRALWWGIYSLGLAVVGMAIWIVNLFAGGHIK